MPLGEAGDADAEAAAVRGVRAAADEFHQLLGVAECVGGAVVIRPVAGRIAAERQDVLDAARGVAVENAGHLVEVVAHACQVRNGRQLGFAFDADNEVVRALAGRTARPVGHRYERRLELLQRRDRAEQLLARLVGLRREELEAERRPVLGEDVLNVHRLFVRKTGDGGVIPRPRATPTPRFDQPEV
jgi:hypothetical protein